MSQKHLLRELVSRAVVALATTNPAQRKRAADERIGYLSAAESDPSQMSVQFRAAVKEWFAATEQLEQATKLAKLLAIAQIELHNPQAIPDFAQPDLTREGGYQPREIIEPDTEDTKQFGVGIEYSVGDTVTLNRFDGTTRHYMILRSGAIMVTPPPKRKAKRAKAYTQKAKRV